MNKFFMTAVVVGLVWWASIATVQFLRERKRRLEKKAPKVGDYVRILSGTFNGKIGRITGVGANHNNDGFYCFVKRPDGEVERFHYPAEIMCLK